MSMYYLVLTEALKSVCWNWVKSSTAFNNCFLQSLMKCISQVCSSCNFMNLKDSTWRAFTAILGLYLENLLSKYTSIDNYWSKKLIIIIKNKTEEGIVFKFNYCAFYCLRLVRERRFHYNLLFLRIYPIFYPFHLLYRKE